MLDLPRIVSVAVLAAVVFKFVSFNAKVKDELKNNQAEARYIKNTIGVCHGKS